MIEAACTGVSNRYWINVAHFGDNHFISIGLYALESKKHSPKCVTTGRVGMWIDCGYKGIEQVSWQWDDHDPHWHLLFPDLHQQLMEKTRMCEIMWITCYTLSVIYGRSHLHLDLIHSVPEEPLLTNHKRAEFVRCYYIRGKINYYSRQCDWLNRSNEQSLQVYHSNVFNQSYWKDITLKSVTRDRLSTMSR